VKDLSHLAEFVKYYSPPDWF